MTAGVLNYPRRVLSERESIIREALGRLPASPAPQSPYTFVPVTKAASLGFIINNLPAGGEVWLEAGTYPGDLTITNPNVILRGSGADSTYMTGSVAVQTGNVSIHDMTIRGTGKTFGLKVFKSGGDTPRCKFSKLIIGASSNGGGDGPERGIWLDGTILTTFDQCVCQFNTKSGLYVDTSSGTFTTNVNTFRDCTFNSNGTGGTGYGVEMIQGGDGVAGMMLHKFEGGNMENNPQGDFFANNNTGIIISGVDFETSQTISQIIDITSSQPVVIENCNFVTSGGSATRFFLLTGCAGAVVRGNRTSGFSAGAIGIFSESCVQCSAYDNVIWNDGAGRVISNRGSMRGNA